MSTMGWIFSILGGSVVMLVLLVVVLLKVLLPRLIKKGVGAMFGAKAAALKGAEMSISSVSSTEGPPREAFSSEEDHRSSCAQERAGGRWVRIEATVTPKSPDGQECNGGFTCWEPDELSLISTPPNGKLDLDKMGGDEDIECFVVRLGEKVRADSGDDDENDEEYDDMKIQGPCQVVLTAYVPNKLSKVSLHYYTELVGDPITLPV